MTDTSSSNSSVVTGLQSGSARSVRKRVTPMSAPGDNIINLQAVRYGVMRSMLGGIAGAGRGLLARLTGGAFGGKRDLYETFGWDRAITAEQMWSMYTRGGIARRLVHAYPDAVWGNPPTFDRKKTTTAWIDAWDSLVEDQNLWAIFHRLDRLSQLGQYAVLLIGTDDGQDLSRPLRESGSRKVLYLQPYSDRSAVITKWGTDPTKANFNLPEEYTIYPDLSDRETRALGGALAGSHASPSRGSFRVHHSRVLHVTQSQLESDVFGAPLLWSVWNYLTDLMKVVGGSAESYWLTANRGMHANLDPEVDLEPEDEAALTEEIEEYQHGLRRFIRTRGVDVKSLGTDVADPKGPFEVLVTLIAGAYGVPRRVLLGSESGHNASTQDKGNWAEHVLEYRKLTAVPNFLRPFIKRMTQIGVLPVTSKAKKPVEQWPDAYRLSPLEEGQRANQRATAAANLSNAISKLPNIMGRQEGRTWLGLDPDDKGDEWEITSNQPEVVVGDKSGDGGVEAPSPGSGTTATPTSDSNGRGDPVQAQK